MSKATASYRWVGGTLLILCLGVLGFYGYKATRPFRPFEFLYGLHSIRETANAPLSPPQIVSTDGTDYTAFNVTYDVPEDFDTFRLRMEREILPKGFKLVTADSSLGFYAVGYSRPSAMKYVADDVISLFKDMRYHPADPSKSYFVGEAQPGWCSVQVMVWRPRPSLETYINRFNVWAVEKTRPPFSDVPTN